MSKLHNEADSKDAIQDTFILAFQNMNTLENNKNFKAWISRILRNKCYAMLGKCKEKTSPLEDYPSSNFNPDTINDDLDFKKMLKNLNEIEKEIFKLRFEDGLSIKTISKLLNIKENTVKTHLRRGKQKLSRTIKPITIVFILCAFLITSVIAACVISYVKELFDTKSTGLVNDGVLNAIENLEWFQDIDMDYIDLEDGYKIKLDYLLMDEMNLYLIFDFISEEDISIFKDVTLPTLIITNENGKIICDRTNLFSNQYSLYIGDKLIDNNSHHISFLVYMYTDNFPISQTLNINFSKITLAKKIQSKTEIYCPVSFSINLIDKFIKRKSTYYTSNNIEIEKAIITETGFYSIISLDKSIILKDLILKNSLGSTYKCYNALLTTSDIEKRKYIILSDFNNTDSDTLKLIINNNEYILQKN